MSTSVKYFFFILFLPFFKNLLINGLSHSPLTPFSNLYYPTYTSYHPLTQESTLYSSSFQNSFQFNPYPQHGAIQQQYDASIPSHMAVAPFYPSLTSSKWGLQPSQMSLPLLNTQPNNDMLMASETMSSLFTVNEQSFASLGQIKLIDEPIFFLKKKITLVCSDKDKLFLLNQINAVLNEAVQLIESSDYFS